MKKCPYCLIEVGGNPEKCPLCQSRLTGEGEEAYFPVRDTLKFMSFLYKMQMFIVLSVVIVGLGLDFLFGIRLPAYPNLHWSLILAMWLLVAEFVLLRQFRPGTGSAARRVTIMVFLIILMLLVTAYFFDFMWLAWDWMVPIVIAAMGTANLVLAFLDKHGNAMAYLLSGLFFGLIPCIVRYFIDEKMPVAWMICMIIALVLFAGVIIFKGRAVAHELRRRFNL
ncbi:MAG: hypothetical protein K6E62_05305 [Lachnospiraceae bacterium]|nr:hypothetical protein [Lachnospiraceae bacterium]